MNKTQIKTLVPMSKEELKIRGYKNYRGKGIRQLWYVDGLGEGVLLLNKENDKFGMSEKWLEYMTKNLSIKYINEKRKNYDNRNEFNRHE